MLARALSNPPGAQAAAGGSATSYTLVLSSALPAADLEKWFAGAAAGERAVYAAGLTLLQTADGVRLARRLQNERRAELSVAPDPAEPRRRQYWIEKVEAPRREAGRSVDRGELGRLLDVLRRCAERDEACPSNAGLAQVLGLERGKRGADRAQYALKRLAAEKRIAIDNRGRNAPRVVTILAAGRAQHKRTAE